MNSVRDLQVHFLQKSLTTNALLLVEEIELCEEGEDAPDLSKPSAAKSALADSGLKHEYLAPSAKTDDEVAQSTDDQVEMSAVDLSDLMSKLKSL